MYCQNTINRKFDWDEDFWFENVEEKATFSSPLQKTTQINKDKMKHKQDLWWN